ncbi:MAG: TonB-dependent receptor [Bacteroidales bacterium]|nr:TonB-dependent receptor [Bacteroidales bacterium]
MKIISVLFSLKKGKGFDRLKLAIMLQAVICMTIIGSLKVVANENNAEQPGITITGTITDENGATMPGVNILEKGTTNGVVSTLDGSYQITVPASSSVLVFSFIGYLTDEIEVGNRTVIDISMVPDIQTLDEVVVIGYGSMERTNVTGAISTVKGEEIAKIPIPNAVEALRAQVPGVRITRTNGSPGSGVEVLIRGKKSIGEDNVGYYHIGSGNRINENEPLIVIDGVPTTGGNINEINPSDIESIDILKDAAAASIYGARGTNGVILITTKSGTEGKPTFSANVSYGVTSLTQKPTMFNAEEYLQLKMDAAEGAGRDHTLEDVLTDPVEIANWEAGKEINWHDEMLRTGNVTDVGLSVTGGTEKFRYYMTGGAYMEKGIVQHSDYNRYSLRLNSDYSPYRFLTAGVRVQFSRSDADETGNSAVVYQENPDFTDFIGNSPLGRLYDENGNLVSTVKGDQFQYNPLFRYQESQADRKVARTYLNPYLKFTFIKGLTYTLNGFVEQRNELFKRFTTDAYNEGAYSTMMYQNVESNTYMLDNILNFNRKILDKHSLDITLVYGFQKFLSEMISANNQNDQGEMYDALNYYSFPTLTTDVSPDETAILYYVGRIGYSFDSRYSITATMRRDGSSKFGPANKWGNFPSISGAWNVSNESFMENVQLINLLKYRIGYGVLGNDRIPNYGYISLTGDATYSFNGTGVTGKTTGNFANESLKWEESRQFNTGIDFSLFMNRLSGTVDYYTTKTTDLLLPEKIDPTTGFSSTLSNVGELKSWGLEASLNGKIINGDFKWAMTVNWAKDKHEIVRLSRYSEDAEGNPIDDIANGWFIGEDIDVIYDYDFIGIYQLGEEDLAASRHPDKRNYGAGDPKIRDIDGNDTINADDRTFLGQPTPSWYGGLLNTFSYKGLELSVLFESVQGVTKSNSFYSNLVSRDNGVKVDYWTPRNPSNEFPQPDVRGAYHYESAVKIRDASFIALRNVSLQYTLPTSITEKIRVKRLAVYIRGNNLIYFTKYKDAYSPESVLGQFPTTRIWSCGLNATF